MAIREIRKKGDPILSKVCKPVVKFDEKLHILLDDMLETLRLHEGVGLAGPQVGVLKRIFIIDYDETGSKIAKASDASPRESQNLEKMYLAGVFGGIPLYDEDKEE